MGKKRDRGKKIKNGPAAFVVRVLFFGAFAGFGMAAIGFVSHGVWFGMASGSWPTTQAYIHQSEVLTKRKRKGRKKYVLNIEYSYEVNGVPYSNNRAQFLDNMFYPLSRKQDIVARHKVGSTTRVFYDEASPQRSVLIPGPWIAGAIPALLLGGMFLAVSIWGLWPRGR